MALTPPRAIRPETPVAPAGPADPRSDHTAGIRVFVRLKLRLMVNSLRGSTGRIVLFVLGAMLAGSFAVGGFAALAVPGILDNGRVAQTTLPLSGAVLVLGWTFLPLLFFGVDESLDPARFALLPLRRRTLISGFFAAALVSLPALSTLAATMGMVFTAAQLGGLGAALVELTGVVGGLLLCVAISRALTSALATGLRSRRARDLATIVLAGLAATLGPLQVGLLYWAENADWDTVEVVAKVLGWTPLGAPYSLGLDVAAGRAWAVPVKVLLVAATVGALLRWWSASLENAMLGTTGGPGATKSGGAARSPVERLMLAGLPQTRFGALIARELRYWRREPRRRTSLITFSLVILLLPMPVAFGGNSPGGMATFFAALAALALANQFGNDATAYAANIVAGVPGRAEVQSRAVAYSIYMLPLLTVVAVAVGALTGRPSSIGGTLGLLVATFGVGLGLVLPLSVRAAYALPETTNPFATSSGAGFVKGLLTFAVLFVAIVATVPMQIAAHFLPTIWLWLGLPVGAAYGLAAYLIGSGVAGDMLDRRMPELLATITPSRT